MLDTLFPTGFPTPAPSKNPITPSLSPTLQPTPNPIDFCYKIRLTFNNSEISTSGNNCGVNQQQAVDPARAVFGDDLWRQSNKLNNKYEFRRRHPTLASDFSVYFSDIFNTWVLDTRSESLTDKTKFVPLYLFDKSVIDYSSDYPPYTISNFQFIITDENNGYIPICSVTGNVQCFADQPGETRSPTVITPPTSRNPTSKPTSIPTQYPSATPSKTPSDTPTQTPTQQPTITICESFRINGITLLGGQYNRQGSYKQDRNWYKSVSSDAQIFYSSFSLHNTWMLYSELLDIYYLSRDNNGIQPPESAIWDFYSGSNVFSINNTLITRDLCNDTFILSETPTFSPTVAPTGI